MRKTLFSKLFLVVLTFCLTMTGICIVLMRIWHASYHAETAQTINLDLARLYVEADLFFDSASLRGGNYQEAMARIGSINPAVNAYLLDQEGRVMASSLPVDELARKSIDVASIESFIEGTDQLPLFGDDPQKLSGRNVFSAASIAIPDSSIRYLYLMVRNPADDSAVMRLRQEYAVNEAIRVLSFSALFAIVATLVVMRVLTQKLGRLEDAMIEFRASGFAALPPKRNKSARQGDEIERLTAMFWEQAEVLQARLQELRRSDEIRREILANVSHDLRTPIATLMAHIETLALKPDMPIEEREQYLKISLRQCQDLGNLVDQLLTVARLDAGQVPYEPEPFNVSELLSDVAQKFQLQSANADIELKLDANPALPMVNGDVRLIERALDNLIDNALQYSQRGECVRLLAECSNTVVRITVADCGAGMSDEEQKYVTERFYRAGKNRVRGVGHAGLGLAIVNAIVELHGSQLDIESSPGVGTRVSFELAIV